MFVSRRTQEPGWRRFNPVPWLSALLLVLPLLSLGPVHAADKAAGNETEPVVVFAAASMRDVLAALSESWQQSTGQSVSVAYAGTSALARQLEQGAPADVFISADQAWMDYLSQHKLVRAEGAGLLARNELVLIAPLATGAAPATPAALVGRDFNFARWLGADDRLAMANADHVPAGRYARQALTSLGLFGAVRERLTYSANVRLALALVARQETPLGIVYASDASAEPAVRILGRFGADTHTPIVYPAALVSTSAHPQAASFLRWLLEPTHADTLARFGFRAP